MTTTPSPDPRRVALEHAAAGVLHQPEDAAVFIDLAELDVDADGTVDLRQARWLIERLANDRPHLFLRGALPTTPRPVDFDAGARTPQRPKGPSVTERFRQILDDRRGRSIQSPEVLTARFAPGRTPGQDT